MSSGKLDLKTLDDLLKAMLILARTVETSLEERSVESAVGRQLSKSKVQILRLLGLRSTQTAGQVARFLGVSNPAVSQIIDSMSREKLVVRKTGQHDRREVNLHLTERGRQYFHAIRRQQRHLLRNALQGNSSQPAAKWIAIIQESAKGIAEADQAFEHYCLQCGAYENGTCVLAGGGAECSFLQHVRSPLKSSTSKGTPRKGTPRSSAKTTRAKRARARR